MKWKLLILILGVLAVGAVATTIIVHRTQAPPAPLAVQAPGIPTTPGQAARTGGGVKARQPSSAKVATKAIPAGTNLEIELTSAVSSSNASVGDVVQAQTTEPLTVDGIVLAPTGSAVTGTVTDVLAASRTKSKETQARVNLEFNSLATVGGSERIQASLVGGEKRAGSTSGRDAAIIVGSGVAGAVLGKIFGKTGKATAIGGVAGTAAGIGVAAIQKGTQVNLPVGTKLTIVFDNAVQVAYK